MNSPLTTVLLPLALAIVMFGLGLSLTWDDFARIRRQPRPVLIALGCQLVLLPLACFALVVAFGLTPLLAVGMMLLAASPGGTTANLYSHLFRGDVALNITLTAINSVIAVASLPLVTNLAIDYFAPGERGSVGLQFSKVLQVFVIVLVPVVLGMGVHRAAPGFARRMDRPVRMLSIGVLVAVILGTVLAERENVLAYLSAVGPVCVLFCAASLSIGYFVPRLLGVEERQAVASAFEIGIHNSTLAMAIAIGVLGSVDLAVPAAVYAVVMFPLAALFGWTAARVGAAALKRGAPGEPPRAT
jgi:bile acid:Na+ symporter, BASS family